MKVIAGLSGGVDSAVSAGLLKRAGAQAVGAFIKTWQPDWIKCTWKEERRDAMRVAAHLDIPFITVDLEQEYKRGVADYMIAEYKAGRTPNPDVMCNKEIKFCAFMRKALELGADFIATGHYAQIRNLQELTKFSPLNPLYGGSDTDENSASSLRLLRGVDPSKDQSYFLWTLTQEQLSKTIFPIGHLMKSEVRQLAREFKLPVAEKRDSQGICFLGHVDMKNFLSHYIKTRPGKVFDPGGRTLGAHDGAIFYTLGQKINGQYVVAKDIAKNTLTVNTQIPKFKAQPNPKLQILKLKDTNWISGLVPSTKYLVAQIRYHGEKLPCAVSGNSVTFAQPTLVASGQSIVFYDGETCLGGGVVA